MAVIKVAYGSTSRRLTISSTTIWSELEAQFRDLFNIPKDIQMKVTYTDEEDDVITISSDLELQDVLSNSSNNTIKFALTTPNVYNDLNNNNAIDREKSIDTVIDEETSNLINGVSAIHIEDSNNTSKHVTITDEIDESLFNQQQQQYSSQETPEENSKRAAESTNNNNVQEKDSSVEENQENNDDDEAEIIVIITRNPWLHRRRERLNVCNPYYYYHNFGGISRHGCHNSETRRGYDTSGCDRTSSSRGYGCGRYYRRRHRMSSEVVAEKIETLSSMGFFGDNLEELIRKHNGNLESIIEVLLLNQYQQNEQNNEKRNKEVVREENDQSMEVEDENNRPYIL